MRNRNGAAFENSGQEKHEQNTCDQNSASQRESDSHRHPMLDTNDIAQHDVSRENTRFEEKIRGRSSGKLATPTSCRRCRRCTSGIR